MSTIPCTKKEFLAQCGEFWKIMSNKNNTQEGVGNAYKCLVLYYFGMEETTDDDLESCASMLKCVTDNAMRRGWHLQEPDLGQQS